MTAPAIEVEVEDPAWTAALPDADVLAARAAEAARRSSPALRGTSPGGAPPPFEVGGVTVLLASDAEVRALNARFRGQDEATNVLAFPAGAHAGDHAGDLALAFGVCAREAAEQGKALADHLAHLVVHGALHLLGHDHEGEAEAEAMEALERGILAGLGVADPYAERVEETRRAG